MVNIVKMYLFKMYLFNQNTKDAIKLSLLLRWSKDVPSKKSRTKYTVNKSICNVTFVLIVLLYLIHLYFMMNV